MVMGKAFSFLVAGHLYGAPGASAHGVAPTLVHAIPRLATGDDRWLLSLGDLVQDQQRLDAAVGILRGLAMPVLNAPGNHDWSTADYRTRFGDGYGCFAQGSALVIVLNTEIVPWHIADEQLVFFHRCLDWAAGRTVIRHVFVAGHRNLFAVEDPRYRVVFEHGNSQDRFTGRCNFQRELLPRLTSLARNRNVYWLSGDVGAPWSEALLVDRHPTSGIHFIATGLGGGERDHLLRVHVDGEVVGITVVPLDSTPPALESSGVDDWRQRHAAKGR